MQLLPNDYSKPYLSLDQQVELLLVRGMGIEDKSWTHECLERIGYYRLSGYWYPYRKRDLNEAASDNTLRDEFIDGAGFSQVMRLYAFDRTLRLIMLDALERVEIATRVSVALQLGQHDRFAHRLPQYLASVFTEADGSEKDRWKHPEWLRRVDEAFSVSKETFAHHFRANHPRDYPPIWIAIELLDFGTLSTLLSGLQLRDIDALSTQFGFRRPKMFRAAIRNLNFVRNVCAHHGRLWDRFMVDQVSPPKGPELGILKHLTENPKSRDRVYASAAILQFFLRTINPESTWHERLKQHCGTFPADAVVNLDQAGFPDQWEQLELWHSLSH